MTRVQELTLKLLDGPPAEDEAAELDALLLDPAARAEHVALLELEAALRGLRTDFDLSGSVLDAIRAGQADRTAAAVMAAIATGPAPAWAGRRRPRRWALAAAGAAVAVAVLVGVWLGNRPEPVTENPPGRESPAAFATLTRVSGTVELLWPSGQVQPAEPGLAVAPGIALRTVGDESVAVVELPDQTRVEVEPDTTVRFPDGGPRVVLAHGQLRAEVPDRAGEPMVVRTPGADVITRGAAFLVASAGGDSVRVEPWLGSVQLVRADAPKPVAVAAGRAGVARPGPEPLWLDLSSPVSSTPRRTLAYEAFPGMLHAVFAPDGREVWAATGKRIVRWTADGGTADAEFYRRAGTDGVTARFSPDPSALVTFRGEKDDGVVVRDAPDGAERVTIPTRVTEPRFLAVAPAAAWVATLPRTPERTVAVWDGRTGAERFTRLLDDSASCLAATPDGRAVAVGVSDLGRGVNNKVVFFDAATGERLFALPTQRKAVTALAFTADGRYLAVGFNGLIQLWDVPARELVRTAGGFERVPTCLDFAPDGRLAAGMQDGQVWVWPADLGPAVRRLHAGLRGVRSVHFAPDGRSLVVAANKAPVTVWDGF